MPESESQFVRVLAAKEEMVNARGFSVEIFTPDGDVRVSDKDYGLEDFTNSLETLTKALQTTIQKISPKKASIEFGIEVAVESGKLTALLVKGSSKANLKVTLEWS
jgi:hypothetical protein